MSTPDTPDPLGGSGVNEPAGEPVQPSEPLVVDEDGQLAGGVEVDPSEPEIADLTVLVSELAERTADLQRVQAEYTNYRRRVERDREQAREQAVASTLAELLPVLDDLGRARAHDELTGAFRSVGESLEASVAKLGLERFGEAGDPFDPLIHEALSHVLSPDVTETTCVEVYQLGYRFAGRVVRPARVVVADPADPVAEPPH
jgi:molecular chaperone GrpE